MNNRPNVAYYYPAPYWMLRESDWIKSLLLFFDQIAILLPDYMYGRHEAADPTLAGHMEDRGLLRVLEPKKWIDEEMANQLAEIIVGLLTDGAFDNLPKHEYFQELSRSRIGYGVDMDLSDFLVKELKAKGLARLSEDGVSVPLHPTVRTTILVVLAQLSRRAGTKHGLAVHPTTNAADSIEDLSAVLSGDKMPSRGKVIEFDLQHVSFDMGLVPLDEIIQFRDEHRDAHSAYMRNLQQFMAELADMEILEEREALLLERRQEIADAAADIRRFTMRELGKNPTSLGFALGFVGSAWSLSTGDYVGAALAAAGGLIPGFLGQKEKVSAYSYLFSVGRNLGE